MKIEKSESFNFETYFINRKYYINRSFNFIYNKPFSSSSPFNNDFQKKKCFICDKIDYWFIKHTNKKRQKSRNKFVKRFTDFINKRYDSYIQKYEDQEDDNVEKKNFKTLTLDIQDDLKKIENFVTVIFIIISNQAYTHYLKFINRFIYHVLIKLTLFTRYDFKQFYDILLDIEVARTFTSKYN